MPSAPSASVFESESTILLNPWYKRTYLCRIHQGLFRSDSAPVVTCPMDQSLKQLIKHMVQCIQISQVHRVFDRVLGLTSVWSGI